MVTSLLAAIAPCERTLSQAKAPERPPLTVTPPAGMTTVPLAVAVTLMRPSLRTVPPVYVLAAVRVITPLPDLVRRTALPAPLSAMTELITSSPSPMVQDWLDWVETAGREIVTWVGLSTETT